MQAALCSTVEPPGNEKSMAFFHPSLTAHIHAKVPSLQLGIKMDLLHVKGTLRVSIFTKGEIEDLKQLLTITATYTWHFYLPAGPNLPLNWHFLVTHQAHYTSIWPPKEIILCISMTDNNQKHFLVTHQAHYTSIWPPKEIILCISTTDNNQKEYFLDKFLDSCEE